MTAQWALIARTEVPSNTTAVTFTSIGSYESYRIISYSADTGSSDYLTIYPNNAGSNLYSRGMYSNASAGSIARNNHPYIVMGVHSNSAEANSASCNIIDIGFAQSTTLVKPVIGIGGWAGNMMRFSGGAWATTGTAISSIYVKTWTGTNSIISGSIIALYGRNV